MKVQSQLVKDPPDIDFAFLLLPSFSRQRKRKMTQQKFVGDVDLHDDVLKCIEEEVCYNAQVPSRISSLIALTVVQRAMVTIE